MSTSVVHVSIAMLLSTLAADAAAQQRAPLLHPAPEQQKANSQRMVAPRNSLEALDRHFSQLDRRRLVVRPGPRLVNPEAARVRPNPQLVRTLEAHGRTLRAAPAAAPKHLPGRETSAVFTGYDCAAARRQGLQDSEHLVLEIRPKEDKWDFLRPGVAYEAYGCSLGRSTVRQALLLPMPGEGMSDRLYVGVDIHAWTDSRVAFTLREVPNTYDFLFGGLSIPQDRVQARFGAFYYAPRVSKAFAAIPETAVAVSPSPPGSPAISVPMDFYGLKGAVGVARQVPEGLLPGQDSIAIRLARDVVLESVQVQYLLYDASGSASVSAGPANVQLAQQGTYYNGPSVAKITVTWPVASISPQGAQPIFYSVYALNITLKGPKGMPAFEGIPSIVLN